MPTQNTKLNLLETIVFQRGAITSEYKLGEKIKSLRLEKGLTIEILVYSSDVTFATMSRIEHGKVNAFIYDVLYKISRSLKVELGEMLEVDG